jgi:hypothetical protein
LACEIIARCAGFMLLAMAVCACPVAAAESFTADLGPVPLDAASQANVQGWGEATATIVGKTMTISGNFGGLNSPALEAHVYLSSYIGVPGLVQPMVLTVSKAGDGVLSGSGELTEKRAAALRAGRLYIMIDSQNAPAGNLWGWLLPAHDEAKADVPEQGDWFQPHVGAPLRWRSSDPMGQH